MPHTHKSLISHCVAVLFLSSPGLLRGRRTTDDTTYDTVFQTVTHQNLILRVHLPPATHASTFTRPPAMTLAGVTARHDWIDRQMRVTGYAPVQSETVWRNVNLTLGAAVQAVVEHLQLNPPEVIEIHDEGLRSIQPTQPPPSLAIRTNGSSNGHANGHSVGYTQSRRTTSRSATQALMEADDVPPTYSTVAEVPQIDTPSIPIEFEEVKHLTRTQLDDLLTDETSFLAWANGLAFTTTLRIMATSVLEENVQTAQNHLEQQTRMDTLYGQVTALHHELRKAVGEFEVLERQQDALCAPPDTTIVRQELQVLKRQALDESEAHAETWLDETAQDSVDVDAFVRDFVTTRTRHHERAAKLELLQRQAHKSL
jgi:hypothetical protein